VSAHANPNANGIGVLHLAPSKRFFALLWAILLLLNTAGEGFGLHPCPYHDGYPATSQEHHEESGHGPEGGHSHEGHEHSHRSGDEGGSCVASPGAQRSGSSHQHSEAEPCTHVDACHAPSVVAVPSETDAVSGWAFAFTAPPRYVSRDRAASSTTPYLLPYALAPPAHG